jgi:hypothetical protein
MGRSFEMNFSAAITEESLTALMSYLQQATYRDLAPRDIAINASTAVEVHVDRVLDLFLRQSAVNETALGRLLLSEAESGIHQTWISRHRWLRVAFDIDMSSTPEWQKLKTVVDLRNALVHGGGTLTPRQTADIGKRIDLERRLRFHLDAEVSKTGITLAANTSNAAISIARAYIVRLDESLIGAPKGVRTGSLH